MPLTLTDVNQPVQPLHQRPLLPPDQAADLAALFKMLGNDTRLRLLHALHRGRQVRVSELAGQVGASQQNVSNQLQRMLDRGIVAARRDGNSIYYRIADPCVSTLLEVGVCLLDNDCPVEPLPAGSPVSLAGGQ